MWFNAYVYFYEVKICGLMHMFIFTVHGAFDEAYDTYISYYITH